MAVSYTLSNYSLLSNCNATTGWSGGNAITTEVDFFKFGTACIAFTTRQATTYNLAYATGGINLTTGSPVIRFWFQSAQSFPTVASNGIRFFITDGSNTAYWNILGSDNYSGGWYLVAIDVNTTPTSGTKPNLTNVTSIGITMITTNTTKNAPSTYFDHLHRGDGLSLYGNKSTGVPFELVDIYTIDNTTSTAWGFYKIIDTVNFGNHQFTLGDTGANDCLFESTDEVFVFDGSPMADSQIAFNVIEGTGTTDVTLTRSVFKGSSDDYDLDFSDTVTTLDISGSSFINARVYDIGASATLEGSTFANCGAGTISTDAINCTFTQSGLVTQDTGATFNGCIFQESTTTSTIDVSDLSDITNCDFISDGSNHALEIDTSHAGNTYDLVGCSFTGYATSDGSTGNEVIYNNSGGAVIINANEITGTLSVRNGTGASTTLIVNPVTTQLTVTDNTATVIEGARVLVWVTDNSNYFSGATVSITGTGTTATVSHTAHGMVTGDYVVIGGVTNDDTYNGQYSVTVTGVNSYTYTTNETINIGTATGTITSTFAVLSGLTNSSGLISDTRAWSVDQPIAGRIRKSTSSPYYVTATFTGTIDTDSGFITIIQMVSDE